jgi:hypothetical protein
MGWAVFGVPAFAQGVGANVKPLAYDVVSVKQNKSGPGMMRIMNQPDRFSTTNIGFKQIIQNAYGLKMPDLISGLPGWADSAAFDIEARMDAETIAALKAMPKEQADEQRRQMMQAMLADRFKLKAHLETKEVPIYSLVIAKGGVKLKDADPNNTYPDGIKGFDGVARPGIYTALQEQLGLRLDSTKGPVDTVVVDHVEMPSEN